VCLFGVCAWLKTTEARSLEMYWVDVEGGAATLIVTPEGESVLIDAGNPGGRDAKRIAKAAEEAGVKRIDHLVVTHFHIDHFGGAAELSQTLPIGVIYDNGIPEKNPDNPGDPAAFERTIRPYQEIKAQKRVVLRPGDRIPLKGTKDGPALSIRCLGAMQKVISEKAGTGAADCAGGKTKAADTSDNANSIVLLLKYGDFEMFDGGDLTWNNEARLVCPENLVGQVDIYDVNHHGLDASNNPLLVQALAPTVAIMSNGTSKGCGPETFALLKRTSSLQAIYQTHRNLRAEKDNTEPKHIANLEKDCAANYIKVTVAAEARSYAVSIPGRQESRVFETR